MSDETGIKLELGSGGCPIAGYTHMDIRPLPDVEIVADVLQGIPLPDNSVQEIYTHHTIEHFGRYELCRVFSECLRVLSPNGVMIVIVPDSRQYAKKLLDGTWDMDRFSHEMFGGQEYETNFHKIAFDLNHLGKKLIEAGFELVSEATRPNEIEIRCRKAR